VALIFFLSKKEFNDEKIALLAISPWHLHLSRVALEGIVAFPFFFSSVFIFF